ncbi:MAG: MerR family DNA-binding transcriptional regulator [Ktedonobacteraceae bacterium]|nr:MerR family DNA-binding transcriptional regulator [Ktedonobacteraceae bacterium]
MLKIGEFARLSQVSIKTLRHYDALGVLQPSQIDPENGYRLYEVGQLADVVRILALKDCGFALEEIAQLLRTHDVAAIEALLRQRVTIQQRLVKEVSFLLSPPDIYILSYHHHILSIQRPDQFSIRSTVTK